MASCQSCSGRLFHSVGKAVAKQRSPNWLRDLLTMHVRLSADRSQRQWPVYTHQLSTQEQYRPTNGRRGWMAWIPLVSGLVASATDVELAWCARTAWLQWWDVPRSCGLTADGSSIRPLCRSTSNCSCSSPAECWWKPGSGFWHEEADAALRASNIQCDTWLKPVSTSTAGCRRGRQDIALCQGLGLAMPIVTSH